MEDKVILYIILGIGYFLYSIWQKRNEAAEQNPMPGNKKPVTPPAQKTLEDILRELQGEPAPKPQPQKPAKPKPAKPAAKTKVTGKDILVHEKKQTTFIEGLGSMEPVYERELTDEDKIERGTLKGPEDEIYRIKSVEETENEEEAARFHFDGRQAIISSIILERKY